VSDFEWQSNLSVFFDFNSAVYVLGLKIDIKKGDVVRGFSWISVTDEIATARGEGGGLALWKRDREMESILLPKRGQRKD
jgi:hypothetical protein